jgi:hypothetical protein
VIKITKNKVEIVYKKTFATIPPVEVFYIESLQMFVRKQGSEITIMSKAEIDETDKEDKSLSKIFSESSYNVFIEAMTKKLTKEDIIKQMVVPEDTVLNIINMVKSLKEKEKRLIVPIRDRAIKLLSDILRDEE